MGHQAIMPEAGLKLAQGKKLVFDGLLKMSAYPKG